MSFKSLLALSEGLATSMDVTVSLPRVLAALLFISRDGVLEPMLGAVLRLRSGRKSCRANGLLERIFAGDGLIMLVFST